MTNCAYNGCDRDVVGSVLWDNGTMRNYCQKHIQDCKVQFPELVEQVDLI